MFLLQKGYPSERFALALGLKIILVGHKRVTAYRTVNNNV